VYYYICRVFGVPILTFLSCASDIIGTISIGADMKTALQQEDETDESKMSTDSKGKKVLSPEEKKKKEEEDRRLSEERAKVREKRGMPMPFSSAQVWLSMLRTVRLILRTSLQNSAKA
jgi:hypothetical protein